MGLHQKSKQVRPRTGKGQHTGYIATYQAMLRSWVVWGRENRFNCVSSQPSQSHSRPRKAPYTGKNGKPHPSTAVTDPSTQHLPEMGLHKHALCASLVPEPSTSPPGASSCPGKLKARSHTTFHLNAIRGFLELFLAWKQNWEDRRWLQWARVSVHGLGPAAMPVTEAALGDWWARSPATWRRIPIGAVARSHLLHMPPWFMLCRLQCATWT